MNDISPQRRLRTTVIGGGTLGLAGLVGIGVLAFPVVADGDPAPTKREEHDAELITVDEDPEGPDDGDGLDGTRLDTRSAVSRASRAERRAPQTRASRPSVQTRTSVPSPASRDSRDSRDDS